MNTTLESAVPALAGESEAPLTWTWRPSDGSDLLSLVWTCYQFLPLIWFIFLIHKFSFEGGAQHFRSRSVFRPFKRARHSSVMGPECAESNRTRAHACELQSAAAPVVALPLKYPFRDGWAGERCIALPLGQNML